MAAHMSDNPTCEQPFGEKKPKWQLICMQNRHMSNHFGKISKLSAHVCRMAAHMSVFWCCPPCSHVPRPSTALSLSLLLPLTITLRQSRPLPLPRRGHPPLPRTVPVPMTLTLRLSPSASTSPSVSASSLYRRCAL